MALFESTWDTPNSLSSLSAPSISKTGKKRKRDESTAVPQQNIDLDRLMQKMQAGVETGKGEGKKKDKAKSKSRKEAKEVKAGIRSESHGKSRSKQEKDQTANGHPDGRKSKRGPISASSTTLWDSAPSSKFPAMATSPGSSSHKEKPKDDLKYLPSKKRKKRERREEGAEETVEVSLLSSEGQQKGTITESLTALQSSMRNNLEGARFRFINEQLYKSSSDHAQKMMQKEPQVYAEYHTGFRHQTKSWPVNPVTLIAASLSSLPPRSLIVDLGCGDAQLAKTLVPHGLNVLSFDLVSDGAWVVEADICTKIPLPGSEKDGEGRQAVVDACVCSLSLMSTNWIGCVREAWRILREGGQFVVAEVTSRFNDTDLFVEVLSEVGFELVEKTAPSTHFLLFEFRKASRTREDVDQIWDQSPPQPPTTESTVMSVPTSGVYLNIASSTLSRGTETQGQVPTLTGPPSAARGVKRTPWAGLKKVTDVMSKGASTFGPLKSAIDDVAQIVDALEKMGMS
ncbi:25S rRNA (adenine645-N1)-methyltransferase [Ceratobasidium sp. 392]|nr:25S rRNA (adenine645-N1)-methyltransferase [Ceratobasidium sp. 392]